MRGPSIPARQSGWVAPADNMKKINVDAASFWNASVGAVAAVCMDFHGNYMGASISMSGEFILLLSLGIVSHPNQS